MADYTKITDFAVKDSLLTGNPLKLITGTAHDNEYNAIAVAIASKVDETGGTLTNGTLVNPALGTPASGTLTNCTGLPLAGVTDSTTEALGVGSLELGHATDTTLTRASAGVVAIEGVNVLTTATGAALAGSSGQAFACSTLTPSTGIVGKSDGTSAGAGNLGEVISSTVTAGAPVSLTTATVADVSSITLTPGRWLVFTETYFIGDGSTSITIHSAGMNTTSATFPIGNRYVDVGVAFVPAAGQGFGGNAGPYYLSVSVNTIVYHIARATFTAGTLIAFGTIKAVRI